MKVAVVGATGNVGTSVLGALADEPEVDDITAIARRMPDISLPKVAWAAADIAVDDLEPLFRDVDAVVHLAWLIQPSHDEGWLWRTNVDGTQRVLDAVARAGVRSVIYASSIGAYATGPVDEPVDESWPTTGIPGSQYSRHKAAAERLFDLFEREHPDRRVVRLRKALVFKAGSAAGIRRLFLGPFLPVKAFGRWGLPVMPQDRRFTVQAVHADDVADAYRRAILADVSGAFNIAADPVLTPEVMAEVMGAKTVPLSASLLRMGAGLAHLARLQPAERGWIDLAAGSPVMDTTRARTELGWQPAVRSTDAVRDLLMGFATGASTPTPPLEAGTKRPSANIAVNR